jgi:hypothetical protein
MNQKQNLNIILKWVKTLFNEFSRKNIIIIYKYRTKTNTGGQVEYTKVLEIIVLKELGKIAL